VIMLELPRSLCLARVVRRWMQYRNQTRPDMGGGCPERLDWGFLRWIWQYPGGYRPRMLAQIEEHRQYLNLPATFAPRGAASSLTGLAGRRPPGWPLASAGTGGGTITG
jgi:hypothetical protein